MAKCKAKTASGQPCKMQALKGGRFCFNHAPEAVAERAQARKRGGENRHTPHFADESILPKDVQSIDDARNLLTYTLQEVAGMDNTIARARVFLALFDGFIKSIEIGDIEARLQALEAARDDKS